MRIAIATSSAGHGPIAAAGNLARAISRSSGGAAEVSVIDLPRQLGAMTDLAVNRFYNFSLCHGLLWNRIGVGLSFRLDWTRLGRIMARRSRRTIPELRADAVVFTTPWLVERTLDHLGPDVTTHAVVLDLGPPLSPGWGCPGLSRVHAPTPDAQNALGGRGDVLGIPMFPPNAHGTAPGCERCGGAPRVLMMGGRSGYAGLPRLLRGLASKGGLHVTVLAGKDPAFRGVLDRIASQAPSHVVVSPFVPDVSPFVSAHDVVVSKPGTMTIGDALAHGKPLVLDGSSGLMPQEIGNAKFIERNGAGIVVRSAALISGGVERLIEHTSYRRAARSLMGLAGADRIAAAILRDA